jgi:hypothetical protein
VAQATNPIVPYGVQTLPTFVVVDQVGNIQYKGGSVDTATAKVAELVTAPSIAASASASVASVR